MVAWRGLVTVLVALLWGAGTLATGLPNESTVSEHAGCAPASALASGILRTSTLAQSEDGTAGGAEVDAGLVESTSPVRLAVVGASTERSSWSSFAVSGGLAGRPRGPPSLA